MTPAEIKACREACGMTQAQWAAALGYRLDPRGMRQQAYSLETGHKAITPQVARLAEMYRRFGVPPELAVRAS